jgi:methionine-S-sulfoxide reductase
MVLVALLCSSAFSAACTRRPNRRTIRARQGNVRRRLFLVHGGSVREAARRHIAVSGYMGGRTKNPTYEQVSTGSSGHAEVVQVQYDPSKITYEKLVEAFWRNVDPTQRDGQFCDHGSQYRSAIFYHGEDQKKAAEAPGAARKEQAFQRRDRDPDRTGSRVLCRRGVPPGLL